MKRSDYWTSFWADKSDPLHSESDDPYFDRLAQELRLVIPDQFASVLEVGCGNGALYERLGFCNSRYLGIDYSPTMIEAFRVAFPKADVAVKDFREVGIEGSYDLIFSHGVVQFIPFGDFAEQMTAAARMLHPGGSIVHAGILWDVVRGPLYRGVFLDVPRNPIMNLARYAAVRLGISPSMGHWYSIPAMRALAKPLGLEVHFTGSVLNPYRFHAIYKKPR